MTGTRMRPFGQTIPLEDARRIIEGAIRPTDRTELVPLHEAGGRVLATDLVAPGDVPPFTRAGMDGYAVRAADTTGASRTEPRLLRAVEQVFTGQMPGRAVEPGTCSEIATGAPMPDGADAVVMVEETVREADGTVRIFSAVSPGQNVGRQGADITAGSTVLTAGTWLNASRVGAVAAIGAGEVGVYVRPRVAILSTGNEIAEPGRPLEPGQIHDINRFTLTALVEANGGQPEARRAAADHLDDLRRALDAALDADVLVFSGGSSVGERDLLLDVLASRGQVLFHGISVKPGKPMAFGVVEGKPFFGMPGYPASCLSNALILLAPALRHIARLPPDVARTVTVPLGRTVQSVAGRHQFLSVRVTDGQAWPAFKASGDITSLALADGYIEIPIAVETLAAGTPVVVHLL
ncbi:MAG: gephyrin-like molybdotransferase Glp [Vicinamibacterales bacterium]